MSEDSPSGANGGTRGTVLERLRNLMRIGRFAARNELSEALAETDPSESLSPLERAMLRNVLTLRQVTVGDVMIPRADIVAVPGDVTLAELLDMFRTAGHSRLPVYEETLDDPRGMVHIRDFLDHVAARAAAGAGVAKIADAAKESDAPGSVKMFDLSTPLSAVKMLRPVLFVPASMPAIDLLVKMQASRTHMALVIDEYGGTEGLVSIEDLVEVIVGDIEDEHDESEGPALRAERDGVFVADGRAPLEEVSTALGVDLGVEAEDVDTLAGLIVTLAGRVPVRGEIIPGPSDYEFEIMDADPRRVKRVRLIRRQPVEDRPRRRPRAEATSGETPPEPAATSGEAPPESR
ncbi:hemolysin family protein [Terrirubrum flagellatum]|uniref:hemolysin family protein n=1 Tax=Terrirubrum flagellatum TaxID=2895980 RepID=UPI003CC833AF